MPGESATASLSRKSGGKHCGSSVNNTSPSRLARSVWARQAARPVILLVEDQDFVREVTSQVLRSAGFVVLKAQNAAEASRLFHQHRGQIQLLLTDLVMPGKSGRELAHELKALSPDLKTVLTSGYPEAPGSGDDGFCYLPKPFSMASLLQNIRQVLATEELA